MGNLQTLMELSRACENSNVGAGTSNVDTSSDPLRDHQIYETDERAPIPSTSSENNRKRKSPPVNKINTKKPRRDESSKQTSTGNTFATISIPTHNAIDINEFLNSVKDEICRDYFE